MKYSFRLLSFALVFASCEKTVELDLDQESSKVVIEAVITNQPDYQFVKVSRTAGFYDSGQTPRITDAVVMVEDDLGNDFIFTVDPDSPGYYFPSVPFEGEIGRTYTLTVTVDGVNYTAQDKMHPEVDNFMVNSDEGILVDVLIYPGGLPETDEYYLLKFFKHDSFIMSKILGEDVTDISLSSWHFSIGDDARIEIYSLSRNGFIFYKDLFSLIQNDGGMLSPPPADLRTNLSNGALGFFQVSALTVSKLSQ